MKKIAWVRNEDVEVLERRIKQMGNKLETFTSLIPALRAFDTTRYDIILINPIIAPGIGGPDYEAGEYDNDQRIEEIMEEHQGDPDYWKLAMYAIEVAHRGGAPNERTPILVVGTLDEGGSLRFPNVEMVCRESGAIDYYNLSKEERCDALIRDIKRLRT